eukprot:COSAG02_NODE_10607_length_1901_cov_1.623751_1_plen_99_part_00
MHYYYPEQVGGSSTLLPLSSLTGSLPIDIGRTMAATDVHVVATACGHERLISASGGAACWAACWDHRGIVGEAAVRMQLIDLQKRETFGLQFRVGPSW